MASWNSSSEMVVFVVPDTLYQTLPEGSFVSKTKVSSPVQMGRIEP